MLERVTPELSEEDMQQQVEIVMVVVMEIMKHELLDELQELAEI